MNLPAGGATQALLKDGHRHMSGLEQAMLKNTGACKQFAGILKTSLGPNGMNKMVLNHLDKLFVTSDAATIVGELEVQHPAAKMVVMASKQMESEYGDGTNFVVTLAGQVRRRGSEGGGLRRKRVYVPRRGGRRRGTRVAIPCVCVCVCVCARMLDMFCGALVQVKSGRGVGISGGRRIGGIARGHTGIALVRWQQRSLVWMFDEVFDDASRRPAAVSPSAAAHCSSANGGWEARWTGRGRTKGTYEEQRGERSSRVLEERQCGRDKTQLDGGSRDGGQGKTEHEGNGRRDRRRDRLEQLQLRRHYSELELRRRGARWSANRGHQTRKSKERQQCSARLNTRVLASP